MVSIGIIASVSSGYAVGSQIPDVFLLEKYKTNNDSSKAHQWFLDHDPKKDPRIEGTKVINKVVVQGNNTLANIKPSGNNAQVRINVFAGNASDFNGFTSVIIIYQTKIPCLKMDICLSQMIGAM